MWNVNQSNFKLIQVISILQAPVITNCSQEVTYQHGINGTANSVFSDNASAEFYLEGGQLYNFVVKAKNIDSVESTLASSSGKSNELGKLWIC